MRLAVMQPYFFPYIGYYSILKNVDKYIYLDNVQYIKNGWINRNRILKTNGGRDYITVPVKKHAYNVPICEVEIDSSQNWQKKILNQLVVYKKFAPYYNEVFEIVQSVLQTPQKYISQLNIQADNLIMKYLGLDTPTEIFSDSNLNCAEPKEADEWGLNIALALDNVTEYWNAPGGKDFFNAEKYSSRGIKLNFVKNNLTPYRQKISKSRVELPFEAGLSIIDVLMFNPKEKVIAMLDDFIFI